MNFPTRQAILAYLYSLALSVWSIAVAMATTGWALGPSNGGFNDWPTFLVYLSHTWFAGVIGLVFSIGPYARGQQAYNAAKGGVTQPPPEQNQPQH
jgi:hypothetical protein